VLTRGGGGEAEFVTCPQSIACRDNCVAGNADAGQLSGNVYGRLCPEWQFDALMQVAPHPGGDNTAGIASIAASETFQVCQRPPGGATLAVLCTAGFIGEPSAPDQYPAPCEQWAKHHDRPQPPIPPRVGRSIHAVTVCKLFSKGGHIEWA